VSYLRSTGFSKTVT